jgi:DnaK suppressor protein
MKETALQRDHIHQVLLDHRHTVDADLRGRVHEERATLPESGRDQIEVSDAELQGHLAFALLQMQSESLASIDAALGRLRAGSYGRCARCAGVIAASRLRVLPFAVHCRGCQETLERGHADRSPRGAASGLSANYR